MSRREIPTTTRAILVVVAVLVVATFAYSKTDIGSTMTSGRLVTSPDADEFFSRPIQLPKGMGGSYHGNVVNASFERGTWTFAATAGPGGRVVGLQVSPVGDVAGHANFSVHSCSVSVLLVDPFRLACGAAGRLRMYEPSTGPAVVLPSLSTSAAAAISLTTTRRADGGDEILEYSVSGTRLSMRWIHLRGTSVVESVSSTVSIDVSRSSLASPLVTVLADGRAVVQYVNASGCVAVERANPGQNRLVPDQGLPRFCGDVEYFAAPLLTRQGDTVFDFEALWRHTLVEMSRDDHVVWQHSLVSRGSFVVLN